MAIPSKSMAFQKALQLSAQSEVTMVLGRVDVGKTTLVEKLSVELARQGFRVGVVDADIGQSDIGPPTTVGLGIINKGCSSLKEAEGRGLYFVGSTSPKGHLLPLVVGTKRMAEKARAMDMQRILIDTTGLVDGGVGRTLKTHKIELTRPDLIIAIQQEGELEPILKPLEAFSWLTCLYLSPEPQCRKRSHEERKKRRWATFMAYFKESEPLDIDLKTVSFVNLPLFTGKTLSPQEMIHLSRLIDEKILWAEKLAGELLLITPEHLSFEQRRSLKCALNKDITSLSMDAFQDMLVGLLDSQGETYALGLVKSLDLSKGRGLILVPRNSSAPVHLKASDFKMREEKP